MYRLDAAGNRVHRLPQRLARPGFDLRKAAIQPFADDRGQHVGCLSGRGGHFHCRGDGGDMCRRLALALADEAGADFTCHRRGAKHRLAFGRIREADDEATVGGARVGVPRTAAALHDMLRAGHGARRHRRPATAQHSLYIIQPDQPDLAGDLYFSAGSVRLRAVMMRNRRRSSRCTMTELMSAGRSLPSARRRCAATV